MNEAAIWSKIRELSGIISTAPLSGASKGDVKSNNGLYESEILPTSRSAEEAFDQLRLQTKYLLFDLEATRRENRYLRQMLDTRFQRPHDEDHEDTPPKWPLPGDP